MEVLAIRNKCLIAVKFVGILTEQEMCGNSQEESHSYCFSH